MLRVHLFIAIHSSITFPFDLAIDLKTSSARTLVVPSHMGKT